MTDTANEKRRRPQNRLWFWLAAALIPEAAAFQVESPRAAAQRAEILRHLEAQANDDRAGDESADRHAA